MYEHCHSFLALFARLSNSLFLLCYEKRVRHIKIPHLIDITLWLSLRTWSFSGELRHIINSFTVRYRSGSSEIRATETRNNLKSLGTFKISFPKHQHVKIQNHYFITFCKLMSLFKNLKSKK